MAIKQEFWRISARLIFVLLGVRCACNVIHEYHVETNDPNKIKDGRILAAKERRNSDERHYW